MIGILLVLQWFILLGEWEKFWSFQRRKKLSTSWNSYGNDEGHAGESIHAPEPSLADGLCSTFIGALWQERLTTEGRRKEAKEFYASLLCISRERATDLAGAPCNISKVRTGQQQPKRSPRAFRRSILYSLAVIQFDRCLSACKPWGRQQRVILEDSFLIQTSTSFRILLFWTFTPQVASETWRTMA